MKTIFIIILLFVGCCPSSQTIIEDKKIPVTIPEKKDTLEVKESYGISYGEKDSSYWAQIFKAEDESFHIALEAKVGNFSDSLDKAELRAANYRRLYSDAQLRFVALQKSRIDTIVIRDTTEVGATEIHSPPIISGILEVIGFTMVILAVGLIAGFVFKR